MAVPLGCNTEASLRKIGEEPNGPLNSKVLCLSTRYGNGIRLEVAVCSFSTTHARLRPSRSPHREDEKTSPETESMLRAVDKQRPEVGWEKPGTRTAAGGFNCLPIRVSPTGNDPPVALQYNRLDSRRGAGSQADTSNPLDESDCTDDNLGSMAGRFWKPSTGDTITNGEVQ